jgi:hypothetical protein
METVTIVNVIFSVAAPFRKPNQFVILIIQSKLDLGKDLVVHNVSGEKL